MGLDVKLVHRGGMLQPDHLDRGDQHDPGLIVGGRVQLPLERSPFGMIAGTSGIEAFPDAVARALIER